MNRYARKSLKLLIGLLIIVLVLIGLIYILIQLPIVHNYAKNKAVAFLHDKIKTPVTIDKFSLDFPNSILLQRIYVEDQKGDTLLFADTVKVDISFWKLLRNQVQVHNLDLRGITTSVTKNTIDSTYNFNYILEAFISGQKKNPDTSASLRFSLSKINLDRIRVHVNNEVTGNDVTAYLNHFDTEITKFDLDKQEFKIPKIKLDGFNARLRQTKALSKETVRVDTLDISPRFTLPDIELNEIDIANIHIDYGNSITAIDSKLDLGELQIQFNELDLPHQRADIKLIQLTDTEGLFALGNTAQEAVEATAVEVATTLEKGWEISLSKLGLDNIDFKYDDLSVKESTRGIDYNHVDMKDLTAEVRDIFYNRDSIAAYITSLTLTESSGLDLQAFEADVHLSDNSARLDNLKIKTDKSYIADRIYITYPSLDSINEDIGAIGISAQFLENRIAVSDLLLFAPLLANRAPFRNSQNKQIFLDGRIDGHIRDLTIDDLRLSGLGDIQFHGSGNIKGLPDVASSSFNLHIERLSMRATDLYGLIPASSIPSNIRIPSSMAMQGDFRGTMQNFTTDMDIQSSFGSATIDGTLRNVTSKTRLSYDISLQTNHFDAGQLLKMEDKLGKISMSIVAKGTGTDLNTANASIKGKVQRAEYNGYAYQNLTIDGTARNGDLQVDASMLDPNIRFNLKGKGNLNGAYPSLQMTLHLDTLQLQPLKFHEKDISLHGTIVADLTTADPDYLNGTIQATDAIITMEGERYRLDTINIISVATAGDDSLTVQSEFFRAKLAGQYNLTQIVPALQNTIDEYFDTTPSRDSTISYLPQDVTFEAQLIRSPLVEQIFPELKEMKDAHINGQFNSSTDEIVITGGIPRLRYKELTFENFNIDIHTENNALLYAFKLDKAVANKFRLLNTSVAGKAQNDVLDVKLSIQDAEEKDLYRIAGELTSGNRLFEFQLLPDGLLLNQQSWSVAPDNAIIFGKDGFMVRDFEISNTGQSLAVNSNPQQLNAPLQLGFSDFKIETFTRLMTEDSLIVGGTVNGNAEVKNINTSPVFTADLTIDAFRIKGDSVGNIVVHVDNETTNTYSAELELTGNGNQVNLTGSYYNDGEKNLYDLHVDIHQLNVSSIEGFTAGEIDNGSGIITGDMTIKGTLSEPQIRGDIKFQDAAFTITRFNSHYKAQDEHLQFTSEGLALNDFTLIDESGNEAILSGFVYTTDYRDFRMDLDVRSDNFQVLNSTRENNKLYYGKLFVDTHLHIKGGINNPVVDGLLRVNEKTDLTIVIPEEDPGIVEREGIVEFIDMDTFDIVRHMAVDDSLTQAPFKGLDVAVNITIDKKATLNLIIDEANGDYLNLRGVGNLTGGVDPSGKVTLTGMYEIEEGSYRFSFNQVKREFVIRKGGTILWTGEPLEADVNVTAVYIAETAPLSLVQSQLADADQNVVNTYKQKIPFEILLSMKGELLSPDITFDIELPEKNYGVSSEVTSTVRTRLVQLRTEPSELNKQVFAVLLLNRFISEDPFQNEPREGGITSIARQSASKILSEQLNNIIGGAIAGFDVNFDINSIEDYTTGELQNRTDLTVGLSKQLLDDRLKISVGSNFELEGPQETDRKTTNIAGDVSAEYQLSKDGRYLIRAYRKDEYIIVQGQVVETGIGFVFTADYDQFKDLFAKKTEEQKILKQQERAARKKEKHE